MGTYGTWSFLDWLQHPAELARLRASHQPTRRLVGGITATMHLHPISWQLRALASPVVLEVAGERYEIAAGQFLTVSSWAANRDPDVYTHPETWNPRRYSDGEAQPLLFGAGPFSCVAQH